MPAPVLLMTPNWLANDAVGNDVLGMVRTLHRAGHFVRVHVPHSSDPTYAGWLSDVAETRTMLADPATKLIYHHSIGCRETEALAGEARCKVRALRYHNVTPAHFLDPYDAHGARLCAEGREALPALVRRATHFLTPSLFNATELLRYGADVDRIAYQPCFHRLADLTRTVPDARRSQALLEDGRLKVLFVGRRSPHKGHRHLIAAIAQYVQHFDRDIVLHLIGGADPACVGYDAELQALVAAAGLEAEVVVHPKLPFAELVAFYRHCDVFLCLSEHEGFCLPVIEAQAAGLPVIAHATGGVPEALGPTQPFSLPTLDPQGCASALRAIRQDSQSARRFGAEGARWVAARFGSEAVRARLLGWFAAVSEDGEQPCDPPTIADPEPSGQAFDAQWYARTYPDSAMLGMDPREHYQWLGRRLGRRPAPDTL